MTNAVITPPPAHGSGTPQPWLRNGFWAVSDQALFALSNFAVNILLARVLAPADYGAFAVVYSIFLLLSVVHSALIAEPMLVYGAGRYQARKAPYWRALLAGHWAIASGGGALLVLAGFALWPFARSPLPAALVVLGLASPFMLLVLLARRACYVYLEPRHAALSGLAYLVLVVAGTLGLSQCGWLTPLSAIALMGAGSLASAVWLLHRLAEPPTPSDGAVRTEALRDHWEYGRWAVGAGTVGWIPGYFFYLALPLAGGLEATAALRAMMNLILPLQHAYVAASLLLVPHLVRARATPEWRRSLNNAFLLFGTIAALFWLLLGNWGDALVALLYGGHYAGYPPLLWIVGLAPIAGAGVAIAGSGLRALERPKLVFWSYVASAVVALVLGPPLLLLGGVTGAAVGVVLCAATTSAAMVFSLIRDLGSGKRVPAPLRAIPTVSAMERRS